MPNNLKIIGILLSIMVCLFGCEKSANVDEAPPKTPEPAVVISSIKFVSIDQLNFAIFYKLAVASNESGVIYATDSLSLASNVGSDRVSSVSNGFYNVNISLANFPAHAKVWFKIYYKTQDGAKVYSEINKYDLSLYLVQSRYVVHGLGRDNSHSKEYFVNYAGTLPFGEFDNSLSVITYNEDANPAHYKARINGVEAPISRIDPILKSKGKNTLIFDVPESIGIGPAKFTLFYNTKEVYSYDIIIVNGGLLAKTSHPASGSSFGNYFVHENNLYTYFSYGISVQAAVFYKWMPTSNTWTKLPNPPEAFGSRHISTPIIKGIVYFPVYNGESENKYPTMYQERIWSFNPANNQWSKILLLNTTDVLQIRNYFQVYESFAYQDKLYYLLSYTNYGFDRYVIDVYNPADHSWTKFVDLPAHDADYTEYRTVVNNGKVYVLISKVVTAYLSMNKMKNDFYELDMKTKKFIKKNWIIDKEWPSGNDKEVGFINPYLTSYKGKIYAYGGTVESNSHSFYSSLFAGYDPDSDKWTSTSGYSYYTGWVSQTGGFLLPMNDQLYIGLGVDKYHGGVISNSEQSSSIFKLSIK